MQSPALLLTAALSIALSTGCATAQTASPSMPSPATPSTAATSSGNSDSADPAAAAHPAAAAANRPTAPVEDWSTLSIRSVRMGPASETVTEHSERPTYTRELVRVQWRSGDSIQLFVYLPKDVVKPPAILYLYSYPADIDRFFDEGWATRATAGGFAAIGFASALTGQRYHSRPMKEWFISELQESLGSSVHDVQMILDYLDHRGDIDMGRIGMFGQGSGGTIAALAAEADPRLQAIDILDPWGDWPEWLKESPLIPEEERSNFLKPEFMQKLTNLDPVAYLPHLKLRSLRVQQILTDPVTPQKARDRLAASLPVPEDLSRFEDATAHYDAMHRLGPSGLLKEQLSLIPATLADGSRPQIQGQPRQASEQTKQPQR